MRERPILFKSDLVRAILSGRKTETRRPITPQPKGWTPEPCYTDAEVAASKARGEAQPEGPCGHWAWCLHGDQDFSEVVRCPLGRAGDRLWVRETWARVPRTAYHHDPSIPHVVSPDGDSWAVYRASWERSAPRWTPSIHMPRWACRLVLPIAEVRVERLQDITEEGAVAEGKAASVARWWACIDHKGRSYDLCGGEPDAEERAGLAACIERTHETTARDLFAQTWSDIYGKQDGLRWADSPWVWVVRWNRADIITGEAARPEAA